MARPARAIIDLDAIRHNYRHAKSLAPGARALAIVKANAYGHGAARVAHALAPDVDGFGVASIEEALELRASGIRKRMLLLEGVFTPDELPIVDQEQLHFTLHTHEQLQWVLAARPTRPFHVFLKIDTGMHRLGFAPEQVKSVYAALQQCTHIGSIVLMTHFARADEVHVDFTRLQIERFKAATEGIDARCSVSNSPAILAWPAAHRDWIRPGLMLYGASPLDEQNEASRQLRPAMRLESALISVRELQAGEYIGYGGRYCCTRDTTVGVVAMGYADGYPRHSKDGTPVAFKGQRTSVIGRVSMDMLTIDVTGMDAKVGDRVELWGDTVLASEVAVASATIPYALFTGITRRVPLSYHEQPIVLE